VGGLGGRVRPGGVLRLCALEFFLFVVCLCLFVRDVLCLFSFVVLGCQQGEFVEPNIDQHATYDCCLLLF